MIQPEPILDVVRGLSTIASFGIIAGQLRGLHDRVFVDACDACRGTGILTCPHCHGTAMLVRRPGTLLVRTLSIGNNEDEAYTCTMCGPPCPTDIGAAGTDDPELADHITENLAAAVQNRYPLPNRLPTYAGTVSCKTCFGQGRVKRMTPAMERLLGLEDSWALRVAERMGRRYLFRANRPRDRPRLFMEFPQGPQRNADFPWGLNREKMKIRFSRPVQRRGPEPALPLRHGPIDIIFTSKPSLEKFVLPFVNDESVPGKK